MKKILKSVDYMIIIVAILLFGIGIVALYSANGGVNGDTSEVSKQLIWFCVGVLAMFLVLFIDYDILRKVLDTNIYYNTFKFNSCPLYHTN